MNKTSKKIVHKLLLDTKANIPFPQAQLIIYQPSIKEIGLLGEPNFFVAVNALTKNYQSMQVEDNFNLDNLTNFEIIMSIIKEKTENSKFIFINIMQLLELIFPNYNIGITPSSFIFKDKIVEENQQAQVHLIDNNNFDVFAQIVYEMFGLAALTGDTTHEYNPAGDRARALVNKFNEKRKLLAKLRQDRGEDTEINSVFGRYINILAVGEQKDKNILRDYSVYQLIEEFKRFELKEAFDYTLQAKMAGAKNVKDAKDWMLDITLGVDLEQ